MKAGMAFKSCKNRLYHEKKLMIVPTIQDEDLLFECEY